ncbi:SpoIIE family protein phosphatase [Streptomyces griseorubiginosus]|uniref:SpoIIE family protein phosphatase n=1 Tax=Streptomyces griseorubiginosus TaxID=67304 RepID=UPI001AD66170|nr:SpoIIE family protein phosphatase [Streptomyces griseorubiginosus]MBO4258110.1 SpoIIE family protein phosphatase [Streptomyces griseorubiginosus]
MIEGSVSANGRASSSYPLGAAGVGEAPERDDALVRAVIHAVEVTGAHTGSVFLLSGDHRSLVVAASCGSPPSLLTGWRRIPVSSRIPVAEAYRSGRMVHLAGAEETMRRFPQLSIALPYSFGSASVPVRAGGHTFGAIAVVWTARRDGTGLSRAQRRQLRSTADRLGTALAGLRARGGLGEYDERTDPILVPLPSSPMIRVGLFDWNLGTGALTADDELCAILGIEPREFDGRAATLAARVEPADLPGFRSAARSAVEEGHVLAHGLRILDGRGGHRVVELWGRVPESPDDPEASCHLVGAVLDSGSGMAAVAAIERLADGFFALSPDGRLAYANHSLEDLLRVRQDELLGRRPWDVLPWLADPVYEDRYRAAVVSQQPVSFLVRRPPDEWLVFSLHPGAQGMTGWVSRVRQPVPSGTGPGTPVAEEVPPISPAAPPAVPRVGALYRVLSLGSALTEAVTAHEVFDAVADQLLPAFGGQKLAIAVVEERRLHLLAQRGYSKRFLARFEGTPLHARLPMTDALTSGAPLFVESPEQMRAMYPGIMVGHTHSWAFLPLIASNRPVGGCMLGFDDVHRFPDEERGVLTALGGLIGQALERARLYDAEFALARGLQDALLPHRLPSVPGLRVTGRYLPGTRGMEIGGDWYDVIPTGDDVSLIVGDVEGHNVPAAAAMGQLRSAMRAFAAAGHRPGEVVAGTNRLHMDLDPALLASCCYARLRPRSGILRIVRAGHLPPLLRLSDGHTRILDVPGGPLLGVDAAAHFPESELRLAPGSVLALYTDGLIERRDSDIGSDVERLRASLARLGGGRLDDLADGLLRDACQAFPDRADDIALLLTEYAPPR